MIRYLSLFFALISYSISSFSAENQNFLPGIKQIIDKNELVVSFTPNETAMFDMIDDQKNISGIDVEIAELIAKELGVKLTVKKSAADWNAVVDEVASNQADLGISFISITADRSKKVLYSQPYVQIRQALLVNNLSIAEQRKAGFHVIRDMFTNKNGMVLAVYAGSSYVDFANTLFPGVKIKGFDTSDQMIEAILKREIDALLVDEMELFDVLNKSPGLKVKLTEIIMKNQPDLICIIVNPNNRDLQAYVNNVLNTKQVLYTVQSAFDHTLENKKLNINQDKK